jgi:hypothetical protein
MAGTNERLMLQYKGTVSLLALFYALIDNPCVSIVFALNQLYTRLDIDLSGGRQLDLLGTIIDQARPESFVDDPLVQANLFTWDSSDPFKFWDAGLWKGDDIRQPMSDVDYRLLLKGVIFNQNNPPTIHNIEQFGVFISGIPFLVSDFVGRVEVVAPYELNPIAISIGKQVVNIAQGVKLDLYMGVNPSLGEIFEIGSSDLRRGIGQGYWARKV